VIYGLLGWAAEVGFTGMRDAVTGRHRTWKLQGNSYLWMLPIYASAAVLFEPLHHGLRRRPAWQRAVAYAVGITAVEYAAGSTLRGAVGLVPWDYSEDSRFALPGGAVRLDYLPLWALTGLAMERVSVGLDRVRLLAAT